MSRTGEPGEPGLPGEPGTGGGGSGGTGGAGGHGGSAATGMTTGARYATVFLFVFSLAIGVANLLFTSALVHHANANSASITQLCEAGNESRAQQLGLWTFLISISKPPPHETPAGKVQREKVTRLFIAHIHQVFAPRNCRTDPRLGGTPTK